MNYERSPVVDQVTNLIRVGTVFEVDAATARIKIKLMDRTTNWIPWVTGRAGHTRQWSVPTVGEQLVLLCPDGNIEQAIALPALYQDNFPPPSDDPDECLTLYADGARIGYNSKTHRLYAQLPEGGSTELISKGGVSITGDVSINGNLQVSESFQASGDVSDGNGSLQVNREIFNNHTHPGSSKPPTQKQ